MIGYKKLNAQIQLANQALRFHDFGGCQYRRVTRHALFNALGAVLDLWHRGAFTGQDLDAVDVTKVIWEGRHFGYACVDRDLDFDTAGIAACGVAFNQYQKAFHAALRGNGFTGWLK